MPEQKDAADDDEIVKLTERLLRQLRIFIPLIGQIQMTLLELLDAIGHSR